MKLHILIIITLVISASICHGHAGIEQSIRYYSRGSLINATPFPPEGPGILKIRRSKNRGYGTYELVQMVQTIAEEMAQEHPRRDRLQIGDVANARGGSIGQHKSHQNGLDADIVYYRKNNREQEPLWPGDYVEKFVSRGKVTHNFDVERNWKTFVKLASFPQVERVFVDLAIKKAFCGMYANSRNPLAQQALRIMRPAPLHDDHMHVRIRCPKGSARCISQDPPAPGNGCSPTRMNLDMLQSILEQETGC